MTLRQMGDEIKRVRESKGFVTTKENMLSKLMLVVTELAEAAEDVRIEDWYHFEEEIADAFIRLLDITATLEIDIEDRINRKMEINRLRPPLHGTKSTA